MASNASQNSPGVLESQRNTSFQISDILSSGKNPYGVLVEGDVASTEDTINMEAIASSPTNGQSVFSVYENDNANDNDDEDDINEWTQIRGKQKRQRISTGGQSNELEANSSAPEHNIDNMTVDQKLTLILKTMSINQSKMVNFEAKLDTALSSGKQARELEKSVQSHADRITLLEYRSVDQEARQRRNNLLFRGHPESRNEDTARLIKQFLYDKLGLSGDISIERSHKLGKFSSGRQRLVIVAFSRYQDTERIIANAYKLKGSQYGISRDFPPEITEARKALWPEFRRLQSSYPRSKITVAYPAKIIKDGAVIRDMFPNWNTILKGRRTTTPTCTYASAVQHKQPIQQTGSTRDTRGEQADTAVNLAAAGGSRLNEGMATFTASLVRAAPVEATTAPLTAETPGPSGSGGNGPHRSRSESRRRNSRRRNSRRRNSRHRNSSAASSADGIRNHTNENSVE